MKYHGKVHGGISEVVKVGDWSLDVNKLFLILILSPLTRVSECADWSFIFGMYVSVLVLMMVIGRGAYAEDSKVGSDKIGMSMLTSVSRLGRILWELDAAV